MKKIALLLFTFLFVKYGLQAQERIHTTKDSIDYYVDTVFDTIRQNSLFADNIDWGSYKRQFKKKALETRSFVDILPLFEQVFDSLKDKHSFISYGHREFRGQKNRRNINDIRKPLIDELKKGGIPVRASVINTRYGYLLIPGNHIFDDDSAVARLAKEIKDSICQLDKSGVTGWIIDLRLNNGGSMSPMIAGLQHLIGEGVFVNWIGRNGAADHSSYIGNDGIYYGKTITAINNDTLTGLGKPGKIAILISEVTSSSGELAALAFKDRPDTRFIGERTAGFMTANKAFYLPFDSYMLLAVSYEADRGGRKYNYIEPDIYLREGDDFAHPERDLKVLEAVKWLEN